MKRFFPLFYFSLLTLLSAFSSTYHGAWALKTESLTRELLESARDAEFLGWLKRVRRKIHEYPELGFEEHITSQLIRNELDSLGIEYEWPVAKTGVVATIGSGLNPGSVLELTWMPYLFSKIDGKMHACGHDAHTTMLLGAAKLLQNNRDKLKGTVKLVFQPGEEGFAGAYYMIKDGALNGVKAMFGLHVDPISPVGTLVSKPGPIMAGSGRFTVTIQGKGGHAASPHKTRDPILALSMAIIALQHIVSRETDPLEARVVSIGFVQGGEALNVIPETVSFGGTFRFLSSESHSYLKQRIKELYAEKVPAAFFMIGTRNKTATSPKGWHSPHFVIDEDVLPIGASLHAAVAISYLDQGHAESSQVGADILPSKLRVKLEMVLCSYHLAHTAISFAVVTHLSPVSGLNRPELRPDFLRAPVSENSTD
ncbi:hypothetical protein DH2020_018198 [Rehmannia glutinosa]|uniref:Peptidase M20 dimerisation domain-containing protein n=1 Tax=Rehmannia glutinosa TaxID=99300 RepID=A0ABR0WL05_REHGL